jgi:hypothetical protein
LTPEKRLQHAVCQLTAAIRMSKEARQAVRVVLKEIAQQKATEKAKGTS